jgi:preprotein translocase subunit SecA
MFCENPPNQTDENGAPRPPTQEELEKSGALQDLEQLQYEAYHLWGVKLDLEARRKRTPAGVYEELAELTVRGLSEQEERLLDLIDRVVSAITEESCPATKLPEDWDWKGIESAFREIFAAPLERDIDHLGEADLVVRQLYDAAEEIYQSRRKEMGVDLVLRVFRHIYTQAIDQAWVDHLQNMEHLRDGIGLRGYGQRDPKNEYKKEGFTLFLNMMANVSNKVLERLFEIEIQKPEEIAAMERAAEEKQHADLDKAVARHVGESLPPQDPAEQLRAAREAAAQKVQKREEPKVGRNDLCPCGSGKKFKLCHGAAAMAED